MNVAFTGARSPRGGFTIGERDLASEQVSSLPRGTHIATGGGRGWDELIMEQAHVRGGLYVVAFRPGTQYEELVSPMIYTWCQEIVHTALDPRSRSRKMANWAMQVRAFPLYEEDRSPRSGTWACVRDARALGNLEFVTILRPRGWPETGPLELGQGYSAARAR